MIEGAQPAYSRVDHRLDDIRKGWIFRFWERKKVLHSKEPPIAMLYNSIFRLNGLER